MAADGGDQNWIFWCHFLFETQIWILRCGKLVAHFWKCPKFDLKNLNYKDFGLFLLDIDISRAVFTHLISFCSQSNKNPIPLICVDDVKTLFFQIKNFCLFPPNGCWISWNSLRIRQKYFHLIFAVIRISKKQMFKKPQMPNCN